MPSILPNFEYDIFISYRHKDNKGDRWVTEFVDALITELEATFKEDVSIYFDTNLRDGLLETHIVDKSLEGKLKCLILIPIISQTYCDTNSFAWKHELCAFNTLAKDDQFGRDIKLTNGNVASRILPVKIHNIDAEDRALLENELGGVLRSVEFIYKEAGINRPLKPADDKNDNQNKTEYRNQVNKIANAIKEIMGGLKSSSSSMILPARKDYSDIPEDKSEGIHSIAVLPFANMSSDPEQEFFSDGISEEIINMLTQVPGLKVAGRTSAFSFKGKNQDLRFIGTQLNVNHILEGSVRKAGNKLRITAQLIKVSDGYHLWSEKYDRESVDIFAIQDEIALAILDVIKIKLAGAEKKAVLKKYTSNPEAYQLYLQGRFHHNKWAFAKAIEYYKAAIELEPSYAIAYTGIAYCYIFLWYLSSLPPDKSLPQMKQAAQHSLMLDDEIGESHLVMAMMKMWYEWDFTSAIIGFKKAIELNPGFAETRQQYAFCLGFTGNYAEAINQASIAFNLEPFSLLTNYQVGCIYWMAGNREKAIEQARRLIEIEPNFWGGHLILGLESFVMERHEQALPELELAVQLNSVSQNLGLLGALFGVMGEKIRAKKILEKMENLRSKGSVNDADIAFVYAGLGQFDTAFLCYERAMEKHEGSMLFVKYFASLIPGLEKDPRTKLPLSLRIYIRSFVPAILRWQYGQDVPVPWQILPVPVPFV